MQHMNEVLDAVRSAYPHEKTFLQAVTEVCTSLQPYFTESNATAADYARLFRLTTPERIITFKVLWQNDQGDIEHNIGYRVQFNSALGPYKGGLRFDPSVKLDVLKFLGF